MRAVTIRDVAEAAGVSRQTVSRAINNKGDISPATREHILEVARALGYQPSTAARSLKTKRTRTNGLVVPDIANPFFAEVVRGASEVAYAADRSLLLCNTDERPEREWSALEMLRAHRVDGLVLVSSRLSDGELRALTAAFRPVVLVNRQHTPAPGLGSVVVNDAEAAERAVSYLMQRGHRRIGMLGGAEASRSGRQRRTGYLRAMRRAVPERVEGWLVPCAPTLDGGRVAALDLLEAHPELTALLCYNDLVAVGAMQACRSLGRDIPEDCALVGWDDITYAALVSPALTTVRMPKYQIGARAMTLLLQLLEDEQQAPDAVTLTAELVVRDST